LCNQVGLMTDTPRGHAFRHSRQDIEAVRQTPETAQTRAEAYRLAFIDHDFMTREELRPVRLQLELLKPQMLMDERRIESTVVMFGSARIPALDEADADSATRRAGLCCFYDEARSFARMMTERSLQTRGRNWVVCTGGGPGVMEAGNRGAAEAGGQSIGLNIVLPHEQAPNGYVTPELCLNFHYFAIRKMHFLMRAAVISVFPGGFGTMDEMFEALTLIQTGRMKAIPFLLFGRDWWQRVVNWQELVDSGVVAAEDLHLFRMVETAQEALDAIDAWPPVS